MGGGGETSLFMARPMVVDGLCSVSVVIQGGGVPIVCSLLYFMISLLSQSR